MANLRTPDLINALRTLTAAHSLTRAAPKRKLYRGGERVNRAYIRPSPYFTSDTDGQILMKFHIRCSYTKSCGHLNFHKQHKIVPNTRQIPYKCKGILHQLARRNVK
jgi:hypothetical protein